MTRTHLLPILVLAAACSTSSQPPAPSKPDGKTFALGSTEAEVRAAMGGPPTKLDATFHQWQYGFAIIDFSADGHVIGWWERDRTLPTRFEPADSRLAQAAHDQGTFAKGSSKDEVYGAMGVPTKIDATFDQWQYGFSIVEFAGDRVSGWNERDRPLHVR